SRLLPFRDSIGLSKRRVDQAVRDAALDEEAREDLRAHPDQYRVPRVTASIVARAVASFVPLKAPEAKDIERAFQKARKEAGSAAADPAWVDSVRAGLPERIKQDRALDNAYRVLRDAASKLQKGEPAPRVALRTGGVTSSFTLYRGEPVSAPSLAEGAFLDSLYALRSGAVVGPRFARDSVFVVRVESLDPSYLPPYEAVREAARSNAFLARRAAIEREAKAHFQAHRADYVTKPKWIFDYVLFRKAAPESVSIP